MSSNLERARELFSQGLAAHTAGNWERAEAAYREALALAPGRPSLVFNLGRLMLDRERDEEAEQLFNQVLQAAPDDHEARYNLGVALARRARYMEALAHYDRALALKPDFAEAHSARGMALTKLGRHEAALEAHARSIELQPGRGEFQLGFSRCAMSQALDERQVVTPLVERALLACLARGNVDYQTLGRVAWAIVRNKLERLGFEPVHEWDFSRLHESRPAPLRDLCTDPLLLAALERITVGDRRTEALFTGVRAGLLKLVASDAAAPELLALVGPLAVALAQQCFLNEYVWDVTEAEQALAGEVERRIEVAIESGAPSSAAIAVVACYGPLSGTPRIAEWCRTKLTSSRAGLERLARVQILEPELEAEIAGRVRRIGEIRDPTSLAVRAQYEENPYPRWLSVARDEPIPYTRRVLQEIAPSSPPLAPLTDAPRILIAGSGTGRHAIMYATAYLNARVTAIDLSNASLAYAMRKADELGVKNVEFLQGDILDLAAMGTRFDVISSIGVLHHMADPARGLACLTGLLAPGGYMMFGLYSELARRDIVELRALIAREGLSPSLEGIRACRRLVRDHPDGRFRALADEAADFYSTSMVRDLLFHVMEHRFTIPQIAKLLAESGLQFLGFSFPDSRAKELYRRTHPADPDLLDLGNWAALEATHPWLFRGMYQFWTARSDAVD
jgi:tetratricopeptide (TPR) repeat protein/2-polyprenyl-3-methyl-5-hydroxy-6-metoxy-1,4-benzoquinol methylase